MALSLPRWLSLVVIGFGIAVVVLLRDSPSPGDSEARLPAEQRRASRAGKHLTVAAERLRILVLVDSVRAAMGRPSAPESRVVIAKDVHPRMRKVAETLVAQLAPSRPAVPRVPVDLAVVVDTAPRVRGAPRIGLVGRLVTDYVLPRPGSGERCLVLVRTKDLVGTSTTVARVYAHLLSEQPRERLLGPCAYYERFGHPGALVDRWMREGAWSLGLRSESEKAARPWGWGWGYWAATEKSWGLRHAISPTGFACAAGDIESCERALLDAPTASSVSRQKTTIWSGGIVSTHDGIDLDRDNWWSSAGRTLGPRDWTVLSEMVHSLGPERFQQFWSSTRAPDEAFRAAAGIDIGTWTHDWTRRTYGEHARGPGMSTSNAVSGIAFIVAAILFATFASRRRQVA